MVLYGDPKMNVPGWLAGFGLKVDSFLLNSGRAQFACQQVFAPTMKRDTDALLERMLTTPDSPYVMRQKQCPELYEVLDRRVEEYLSYTSRAPPVVDGVFSSTKDMSRRQSEMQTFVQSVCRPGSSNVNAIMIKLT